MTAQKKLQRVAVGAAALAGAIGAIGLLGFWLKNDDLRSFYMGWRPMSANSALSFVLCGSALILLQKLESKSRVVTAQVLAGIAASLAGYWFASLESGKELTTSNLLLRTADAFPSPDSHLPLNAALGFVILSLGILAVPLRPRSWLTLSNWLALTITNYALLALTGYFINSDATTLGITVGSAVGFLLLGISLFLTRLNSDLLRFFWRSDSLGFITLRLLLYGLSVPLIVYALAAWWLLPLIPAHHDVAIIIVLISSAFLFATLASLLREMQGLDQKRCDAENTRDALLARLQSQAANLEIQVAERTRSLHETSERLQLALQAGAYGVWDWDVATNLQVWDERQHALYGLKPGQFDGRLETWLSFIHSDDRDNARNVRLKQVTGNTSADAEFRMVRADGKIRHVVSRTTLHRNAAGEITRVVGVNRDVTADREREQAIMALNQRLLFVLNATGFGVWQHNFSDNKMEWDDRLLEIYGLQRSQLSGHIRDWEIRVHPEDLPMVVADIDRPLNNKALPLHHTFRIIRPDKTVCYISSRRYLLRAANGAPQSMVGFDSDITDQHALREELRVTEESWQLALAANNDGVWDWNFSTGKVYRNARYAEMVGYEPEELPTVGRIWQTLGHPEDWPWADAAIDEHLAGRTPVYQCEYRLRHKEGHWVWVLDRGKVIARSSTGNPLRVVGTQTDITPRKQLEERLKHSEEMSIQLSRLAHIGAWQWDIGTAQLTWSPEMYRIHEVELGYEPTPDKMLDFHPPQAKIALSQALQQACDDGTSFDLELPSITARGHNLWIRILGRAEIKDERPVRVYGAFQDITARRDAEETRSQLEGQLFQARKMDTLGTLAGGIAHDFNNLLTGILGYQELALETLDEPETVRECISSAREASLRARQLVDHILTFSRHGGSEKFSVDLGQVIEDARRFLRATVPATIRIEVSIDPKCGRVVADAAQLYQVILNLGTNGSHAMRTSGGLMSVSLSPVFISEELAPSLNLAMPGPYLKLLFSDTGHGMDEETSRCIFDPFFTTKDVGHGTGLGLSVVHGIIQSHRGSILVNSSPNHGTTFTIYIPEAAASEISEPTKTEKLVPLGSGQLIAMVDDEDIVRKIAQIALVRLGYRVAAFESSEECLESIRRQPGDYSLLLTDQTMPAMQGIELASQVRIVAPRLPVVIMSGYFSRISPSKLAEIGQVELLSKPFTTEELAHTVYTSIGSEFTKAPKESNASATQAKAEV